MKKLSIIFILILSFNGTAQSYHDSVLQLREEHLQELMDSTTEVLTIEEIKHFAGLDYYPIEESFIIEAKFKKKLGEAFEMPTSTDRKPIYRRYGYLKFKVNGVNNKLTVYMHVAPEGSEAEETFLFVPFRDATSGIETYGAGRYLDFEIPNSKVILLDFNLCYNPYCAYSIRYSCPIPPTENTLKIEIKAGEKTPIGH